MFRRRSGAILCPSCGRLTNANATVCLVCGHRTTGLRRLGGPLRTLFRGRSFTDVVTVACVALYVASLVFDPTAALHPQGMFGVFSPSPHALLVLGASGALPWRVGRWWTIITAIYLHGNLLHILFNVLWIRQLGPAVEDVYGRARFVVVFTAAGALGFLASTFLGVPMTVGASGSIFGLLGALVAFGQRRGGTFGKMVLRQYGQWAIILFIFGLLPGTGVDNFAHAGGFAGGFIAGFLLSFEDQRAETTVDRVLAAAAIVLTLAAFALSLATAFGG